MTGTYREVEFILKLFPFLAGEIDYDIYVLLRHTGAGETSRLASREKDFHISDLLQFSGDKVFIGELPSIETEEAQARYLIPVGPTDVNRECAILSMFHGVFAAIAMMKASMRGYTHVMKTRTDYLPCKAPLLTGMLEECVRSGGRIIVDGALTIPSRYADRPDIPWQGSINDVFCFAHTDRFLALWDIEDILGEVWTGIPETTLFRAAMKRFLGDDLQSHRRNGSLLDKYFTWDVNDTKQSFHLLRAGVFSADLKRTILNISQERISCTQLHRLIRISYDYIIRSVDGDELRQTVASCVPAHKVQEYLRLCDEASRVSKPV
jgi:hypothetical protein